MKLILVSLLLTTSAFLFYGCEGSDPRVEKPLKIKMVNDKPCFYIDPFEDMDRFVIRNFAVTRRTAPMDIEYQWQEGEFETMEHEDFYRPTGNRYLFPPSVMAGSGICVEYGVDIDKNSSVVKQLKTGVVYRAWGIGYNQKQWASEKKNVGRAYFAESFYLQKNEQTGKLEAIVVKNNNQAIK